MLQGYQTRTGKFKGRAIKCVTYYPARRGSVQGKCKPEMFYTGSKLHQRCQSSEGGSEQDPTGPRLTILLPLLHRGGSATSKAAGNPARLLPRCGVNSRY